MPAPAIRVIRLLKAAHDCVMTVESITDVCIDSYTADTVTVTCVIL